LQRGGNDYLSWPQLFCPARAYGSIYHLAFLLLSISGARPLFTHSGSSLLHSHTPARVYELFNIYCAPLKPILYGHCLPLNSVAQGGFKGAAQHRLSIAPAQARIITIFMILCLEQCTLAITIKVRRPVCSSR
jgi:hypothetical protein